MTRKHPIDVVMDVEEAEAYPTFWEAIPVDVTSDATPIPQATDLPEMIGLQKRKSVLEDVRPVRLSAEQSDVGFGVDRMRGRKADSITPRRKAWETP